MARALRAAWAGRDCQRKRSSQGASEGRARWRIANGDVFTLAAAREMLDRTGAAAIMIGRHTFSEPWFLRDVARELAGEPPLPAPAFAERIAMMRRLYSDHVQLYGERFGVSLFRRWIPRFAKGMGVPRPMMIAFLQAAAPAEWEARMAELEQWTAGLAP